MLPDTSRVFVNSLHLHLQNTSIQLQTKLTVEVLLFLSLSPLYPSPNRHQCRLTQKWIANSVEEHRAEEPFVFHQNVNYAVFLPGFALDSRQWRKAANKTSAQMQNDMVFYNSTI